MKLLLTLSLTIFLFNGCGQVAPEIKEPVPCKPTYVHVYKKMPVLKNRANINTEVKKFNLYKEDHPEYTDMYIVSKDDLIQASKNAQSFRKIIFTQNKHIGFYKYQNTKFNNLNKGKK